MPRSYIDMCPPPSSGTSGKFSSPPAQNQSQFSKSKQFKGSGDSSRPENPRSSAEWLSFDGTEPFPDELFRVPVSDAVFSQMPKMSDSALRALLSLIHLSYRYDPAETRWMHPDDWFARSDVEEHAGLSSQGTRNGLKELEELDWVQVDRGGRGFRYQLLLEVPSRRFTFVPTALLEEASALGGTELRLVLTVLRRTWGWTETKADPGGVDKTVHARWTQASNGDLAGATGRSETAVKQGTNALQGQWIERVRPGNGSYQYRFLPEAIGDGSGNPDSFCESSSNDLPPHRQNSAPPSPYKENRTRDKHSQSQNHRGPKSGSPRSSEGEDALPSDDSPSSEPKDPHPPPSDGPSDQNSDADFSNLPPEERDLAEKLQNVGVWANRVAEILTRFSARRIRANFELYRQRAAEQTIRSPGAWLYQAITEGYTLPSSSQSQTREPSGGGASPPVPEHKQVLSRKEMETCVERGIPKNQFHRCLSDEPGARFMYLDPDIGDS